MGVIMRVRKMLAASLLFALPLYAGIGAAVELEKRTISGRLPLSTVDLEKRNISGPQPPSAADIEKRIISGRLPSSAASRLSPSAGEPVAAAVPDYQWWYGCSPTAAGMLMGYYDINGYAGETYDNLIPGAVAERSTFPSRRGELGLRGAKGHRQPAPCQ